MNEIFFPKVGPLTAVLLPYLPFYAGVGVRVMPSVTIGSNVVIGGGSVVVKDIPSNVVAVGNPCHVVRPITDEDAIEIETSDHSDAAQQE